MTPFLTAYLARIGWEQTPDVSLETLRALHLYHNGAIPFENLDVVLPREIELSDEAIFHKLVVARRGGYCFEQNGLFERVLKEVGFTVRSLLGRVVIANPHQMPPRTHRILLVQIAGEPWIADVGFGGQTLTAPIRLQEDIEQATPHGVYRLQRKGEDWVLQFRHHERWQSMYQFEMGQQYQADFVMGNFHSAHWPASHFRHHLLMCRHLPDGVKLTLTNFHFTHWKNGQVLEEVTFADVPALYDALQQRFGLGVNDAQYGFSLQQLETVMAGFDLHGEKV
ncbi:N-hydroxyarylamine O-acetyltransferase [Enterobacter sp. R4-368]|uniref:N-hydroxyarylamine O-acetyltransferase n=1 Tax=Enterobacter sp. R4-368 TaxID=1166130 RepID=UPI00034F08E5|nr:N-hydroxyarylamine O-acetyltransferase [Enterobacter sp. R4-368]AGN84145.1 N-hydroxyarylamine O-acetyltransferase [Enterobacter sp. R4-368]